MAIGESDEEFHSADEGEGSAVDRKPKGLLRRQESKADSQRSNLELQFELKKVSANWLKECGFSLQKSLAMIKHIWLDDENIDL